MAARSVKTPNTIEDSDRHYSSHNYGNTYISGSGNVHLGNIYHYQCNRSDHLGNTCQCNISEIDKADAWIRDTAYTVDRLKIERLSGDLLPMDQCYINLAIVELSGQDGGRSKKGDAPHQSSPFSLPARLKVETPDEKIQIELPTIFNLRKEPNGQMRHPRRILIRGRAGVGKTTLCKKSVHDYFTRGMWSELFDRVLWIPLRRLKGRRDIRYNLGQLFFDEYFSQHWEGRSLSNALWRTLDTNGDRSLFILDGLDEVSQVLDGDDDMSRFLKGLLNRPNVIITSRPYGTLPAGLWPLDVELETIGFYPDQVKDYLGNAFTDPKRVSEVWSFLQHHWLIQGLVRIPIQLDALCYTWDDSNFRVIPQTMATVYRAIEQKLWKKDILRLEKKHDGELVTKGQIQTAGPLKIERFIQDEISFLESLAFTGLYNDAIEFESKYLNDISDHFTPSLLLDKILPCLSFLRTSDPLSDDHNRNYHFLHLTFQEYFAARYFVRCWVSDQPLSYLKLGSIQGRNMIKIPIEKLLQREKYNGRYDIFWRFVAGLLWDYGEEQLNGFFKQIEDTPRDLLGPAHQRLIMHCFNEVGLLDSKFPLKDLREKMEHRCKQWSIYEYKLLQQMHLCRESEFPDKVLTQMLIEGSDNVRTTILQALQGRLQLSDNVLEEIAALLKDDADSQFRRSAVHALGKQSSLSGNILQALVSRLEDTEWHIRDSTVDALGKQSSLPDNIVQALVSRLEDADSTVRDSAVQALGKQSSLPDNILQALMSRLEDTDSTVRNSAIQALGNQSSLPDNTLQALVSLLEDTDSNVRNSAVQALGKQSSLPDNILQVLVSRLGPSDWHIRDSTVQALGEQSSLPDNILQALMSRLEDTNSHIRYTAVQALGKQSSLPENILQALVSRLEDTDWYVRDSTVQALGKQSSLSDNILQALVSRLEHTKPYVRDSAVQTLGKQSSLLDNILQALVSRLEDTDWHIRDSAVQALGEQSSLPDSILQALVSRLEDTEWYVRHSAVQALGKQSSLPDSTLQALVSRLEDTEWHIRDSTVRAIGRRSLLPDNILQALVSRLEDTEWRVRYSTFRALGKQSSLPDNILQALVSRLEDTDSEVRGSAVQALGEQSPLPDNILQVLVSQLGHTEWYVRGFVIEALGKQSSLSDNILQALVSRLEDTSSYVRNSIVRTLGKQSSLPDNILRALVSRLEDTNSEVRRSAVEALDGDRFYFILPSLNTHSLRILYRSWVKRSIIEQFSCYIQNGNLHIDTPNGRRETTLLHRKDDLLKAFLTEATAIGTPES